MSFLAPFFLAGLGALAIPVIVHLIQRERKRVVEFPSLMFVQRIPYQSVRRRRIRHWYLLLMRAAAMALIVAAFARPFFPRGAAAALAAAGGSREIVVLLDQSASMGYGDHWQRAQDAARSAIDSLGSGDLATLVVFSRNAEESIRATSDRGRLIAALDAATVTAGATRYGPALKLAESILARSSLQRKEAILISDFQKSGWTGAEDVHFGEGITLTPVSVAADVVANLAVPSVTFARAPFSNQERVTVTAGITNKSTDPAANVPVTLEIDGHQVETVAVNVGANASTSVVFQPFTLADPALHGVVRAGSDALVADNTFDFVLTPSQSVSVLVIDAGAGSESSFYLSRALSIGNAPRFQVETMPAARVTQATLDGRSIVVLNDVMLPPGLAGGALKAFVERGGGLLVATGERTTWPASESDLLPGQLGPIVDRTEGRGGTIGFRDYSHPVFEVFKAPRSGDFSAARVLRYRALETTPDARILARYDDGAVAAAEKRAGAGRVIVLTSTLDDSWSDLALKPVYLPLVHQIARYLSQYEQTPAWQTVGGVVDLSAAYKGRTDRIVLTPASERVRFPATEAGLLELTEHGVYEIRSTSNTSGRPDRIAVNLDPAESDLARMDPQELVAAVIGRATPGGARPDTAVELTPEEAEKRQNLWWYLLAGGLFVLAAETVVGNQLSKRERFL
ncbi:MAG: VWA domain-containing protein [Luteitalea sp.]|nr:VWA domain-containing protein [Luteitalea sp.]